MGRTAMERKRIYKETVEAVLKKYRMSKGEFREAMEHTASWFGTTFAKGWYDITKPNLKLWAITIGCSEDELTAIPVSPQGKAEKKASEDADSDTTTAMIASLTATMIDGFAMLHQDVQMLIETMHKYWRSEEPKYEIKEREQP